METRRVSRVGEHYWCAIHLSNRRSSITASSFSHSWIVVQVPIEPGQPLLQIAFLLFQKFQLAHCLVLLPVGACSKPCLDFEKPLVNLHQSRSDFLSNGCK